MGIPGFCNSACSIGAHLADLLVAESRIADTFGKYEMLRWRYFMTVRERLAGGTTMATGRNGAGYYLG